MYRIEKSYLNNGLGKRRKIADVPQKPAVSRWCLCNDISVTFYLGVYTVDVHTVGKPPLIAAEAGKLHFITTKMTCISDQ